MHYTLFRGAARRAASALIAGLLLSLGAAAGASAAEKPEPVALTFDDLPVLSLYEDMTYQDVTMRRLVDGLHRRRWPAIGFAIGEDIEMGPDHAGEKRLEQWRRAGFAVGNHTWSHPSLNKTPVEAYIADTAKNDALLRRLLRPHGQRPAWFRHPYLETGATLEAKHQFEAWLKAHGYRVAPVTLENSDWLFSPVYDEALRKGDTAKAEAVRKAYVDYTARAVVWYRKAGLDLLGRRPSFVFLLHACRLNADSLDDLARILKDNDLKPVTLETAMRDPVYQRSDDWADPDGDEWLTRWAHLAHKTLGREPFPEPPADIAAESDKLDPSD